jgi:hypothetical protein
LWTIAINAQVDCTAASKSATPRSAGTLVNLEWNEAFENTKLSAWNAEAKLRRPDFEDERAA